MPNIPVAVAPLEMTGVGKLIVKVSVAVPGPVAFVAVRVTEEVPAVVGVPVITPVVVLTLNPAGKPVALKLVGPLLAVMVYGLIATPLTPIAVVELVMTGVARLMVTVTVAVPVPEALVAPTTTGKTPAVVGVPVMAPVLELILNPAGKPVAL